MFFGSLWLPSALNKTTGRFPDIHSSCHVNNQNRALLMQMWQHELTQHVSVGQKVFMAESLFFASTQLARKRINDCIFSCRDAFVFFNFKIVIDEANNPESWCARWIDLLSHFQNREICRNYRRILLSILQKKSRNGLTRKGKSKKLPMEAKMN